jgi:hypothetical protein
MLLIFQSARAEHLRERVWVGRPAGSLKAVKTTKPSNSGKTGNEGIQRILAKDDSPGWPHPSLCGEVGAPHLRRAATSILQPVS